MMTAPSYMIFGAAADNLPDKTLTFLLLCQMFRCSSCCPSAPRGHGQELLPRQRHSESLRDHWSSSGRSLEGDLSFHRSLPTNRPPIIEQTANECTCESFLCSRRWQPTQPPPLWFSWILWFFFFVTVLFLHKDSVEPVNLFQPSVHMLSVTWRCDNTPFQLVFGSEPLTPAASQTSCELAGEEGPALRGSDGDGGSLSP